MPIFQPFRNNINYLISYFKDGNRSNFAKLIGKSPSTIDKWLSGTCLPDGLSCLSIANQCNISIDWLLHGDTGISVKQIEHKVLITSRADPAAAADRDAAR